MSCGSRSGTSVSVAPSSSSSVHQRTSTTSSAARSTRGDGSCRAISTSQIRSRWRRIVPRQAKVCSRVQISGPRSKSSSPSSSASSRRRAASRSSPSSMPPPGVVHQTWPSSSRNLTRSVRWSSSRTSARTALRSTGSSQSVRVRNQRSRSAYGTAAFAGEVEGRTKRPTSPIVRLLWAVLGACAERAAVGLLADECDRARPELESDAPQVVFGVGEVGAAEVARPRSRAGGCVRGADAEVEQLELLSWLEQPRREPGVVEQSPEVVARVREVGVGGGRHTARD